MQYHLLHPDISLDAYLRKKRQSFGQQAMSRRRIYLDQRFWIDCRDAESGNASPVTKELWSQLQKAVETGQIWCPVYASVWCETMKQSSGSRLATARVIDRLSGGLAIRNSEQRFQIEFSHWVWTKLLGNKTLAHPHTYAWTSLGLILGEAVPYGTGFDHKNELAIQKSMLDLFSEFTMQDMMLMMTQGYGIPQGMNELLIYNTQNIMSRLHKNSIKSFKDAVGAELDGIADVVFPAVLEIAKDLFGNGNNLALFDCPPGDNRELAQDLIATAVAGIKLGKVSRELPFMHIMATLHAIKRHVGQPYDKGDLHDFQHAASALTYCDAFYTDAAMARLIVHHNTRLDNMYNCLVVHSADDIVSHLKCINS